jgi:hypothetical protein
LAALGSAFLLSGCGAQPPELPATQANRVSAATTGISEACGEAYQEGTPSARGPAPASIEAAATMRSTELARVYRDKPEAIFQAQTLRRIVAQSIISLNECGLHGAASMLRHETR